jgi:hypothetical protein
MSGTPRLIVDRPLQSSATLHAGWLAWTLRAADPRLCYWSAQLAPLVVESGGHLLEAERDRSEHRGRAMLGFLAGIALGAVSEAAFADWSLLLAAGLALAALALSPVVNRGEWRVSASLSAPIRGPSPVTSTPSQLLVRRRSIGPPLLFGLRLWASVSLALYVAFRLQLDSPYWAGAR